MAFVAVRFAASAGDTEQWMDALIEAGALSVDVSDPHADTPDEAPRYDEPGEITSLWASNRLTALFNSDAEADAALNAACGALNRELPPHERMAVPDADWVRATQSQFAPMKIADRLWVVPSWAQPIEPDAINLVLDPGLAFGTGSHPTTRLCLNWLASELPRGASVLDYGCGSGILAIAAAKLGARNVTGTDIDPQAIGASRDNARRNGVAATFLPVDQFESTGAGFDVLLANILANPLVLLAPALSVKVRSGGSIVLSGILDAQAEDVMAAYAPWFAIFRWRSDDGWLALAGVRR